MKKQTGERGESLLKKSFHGRPITISTLPATHCALNVNPGSCSRQPDPRCVLELHTITLHIATSSLIPSPVLCLRCEILEILSDLLIPSLSS